MLYMGFTWCPDICPAELTEMANVIDKLSESRRDRVVPAMITVDPRRDSCAQLSRYVEEFHPRLLGLTGTPQQVAEVSEAYRVYSSTGLTEDELDELGDDYL